MRLLVLGLGYSASRLLALHRHRFESVTGTRRAAAGPAIEGVDMLPFDGAAAPSDALDGAVSRASHVLVSIPPDEEGDPVLRRLGATLAAAPGLAWVGYLSTVGVYGDFGGAWVDEETPPRPRPGRNAKRTAVEKDWLRLGAETGRPVQIFRLSGIYGPGRNAIENLRQGTARRVIKPGQVFNRIHVDDIAGAVMAGIARPAAGPVVNVTDDEPAPPQDVVAYAAALLGIEPPPDIPFEEAELSAMGRSFYGENKRVSNRRLREAFGYDLAYPTYREGLAGCLARS